jgi:hypothetical protein
VGGEAEVMFQTGTDRCQVRLLWQGISVGKLE